MSMSCEQVDAVSRCVLARQQRWTRWVPGFESTYASIGLFVARRYLGPAAQDEERLFWLALTVSFWVWLDDRSDQRLSTEPGPWGELVRALEGRGAAPSDCPGWQFLRRIEEGLMPYARDSADMAWWRASAAWVLEGVHLEEEASRRNQPMDYAEYLDAGCRSSGVMNLLTTAALLLNLAPARQQLSIPVTDAQRHLCLQARLENDLHSYERDKREGCVANAILVLESELGSGARYFVEREKDAHGRLLACSLQRLGPEDGYAQLMQRACACHTGYYDAFRAERYAA